VTNSTMTRFGNRFTGQTPANRHEIRKQVLRNNPELFRIIKEMNETGIMPVNFFNKVRAAFRNNNNPRGPEYRRNRTMALPSSHASILNKLEEAYRNLLKIQQAR